MELGRELRKGGCQWSWGGEGVSGVGEGVGERRVSVELGRELRKGGCQWSWGVEGVSGVGEEAQRETYISLDGISAETVR